MKNAIEKRFGAANVRELPVKEGEVPLLSIQVQARTPVQLLMTNGLSAYTMPVTEKEYGKEHKELYFCLPSYWELDDLENPRMNWVFYWIQRLAKYVQENETWFGDGHTMPCGKEKLPLSPSMKQNHFMLIEPTYLEMELTPLELEDRTVHFLAIVPIFEAELNYKLAKGTRKFMKRFIRKGNSEKLDDFRQSMIHYRYKIL